VHFAQGTFILVSCPRPLRAKKCVLGLARRIARLINGATHRENPLGVPRFLNVMTVPPSGVARHVQVVSKTVLHYDARCVADLHAMLRTHGE